MMGVADDEIFERIVYPERIFVVFHYETEKSNHYWRELDRELTVEDMKTVLSGDMIAANGLLNDRISTVETLELTREQIDAIPHDHPEWERWMGDRWVVVEAEPSEDEAGIEADVEPNPRRDSDPAGGRFGTKRTRRKPEGSD